MDREDKIAGVKIIVAYVVITILVVWVVL